MPLNGGVKLLSTILVIITLAICIYFIFQWLYGKLNKRFYGGGSNNFALMIGYSANSNVFKDYLEKFDELEEEKTIPDCKIPYLLYDPGNTEEVPRRFINIYKFMFYLPRININNTEYIPIFADLCDFEKDFVHYPILNTYEPQIYQFYDLQLWREQHIKYNEPYLDIMNKFIKDNNKNITLAIVNGDKYQSDDVNINKLIKKLDIPEVTYGYNNDAFNRVSYPVDGFNKIYINSDVKDIDSRRDVASFNDTTMDVYMICKTIEILVKNREDEHSIVMTLMKYIKEWRNQDNDYDIFNVPAMYIKDTIHKYTAKKDVDVYIDEHINKLDTYNTYNLEQNKVNAYIIFYINLLDLYLSTVKTNISNYLIHTFIFNIFDNIPDVYSIDIDKQLKYLRNKYKIRNLKNNNITYMVNNAIIDSKLQKEQVVITDDNIKILNKYYLLNTPNDKLAPIIYSLDEANRKDINTYIKTNFDVELSIYHPIIPFMITLLKAYITSLEIDELTNGFNDIIKTLEVDKLIIFSDKIIEAYNQAVKDDDSQALMYAAILYLLHKILSCSGIEKSNMIYKIEMDVYGVKMRHENGYIIASDFPEYGMFIYDGGTYIPYSIGDIDNTKTYFVINNTIPAIIDENYKVNLDIMIYDTISNKFYLKEFPDITFEYHPDFTKEDTEGYAIVYHGNTTFNTKNKILYGKNNVLLTYDEGVFKVFGGITYDIYLEQYMYIKENCKVKLDVDTYNRAGHPITYFYSELPGGSRLCTENGNMFFIRAPDGTEAEANIINNAYIAFNGKHYAITGKEVKLETVNTPLYVPEQINNTSYTDAYDNIIVKRGDYGILSANAEFINMITNNPTRLVDIISGINNYNTRIYKVNRGAKTGQPDTIAGMLTKYLNNRTLYKDKYAPYDRRDTRILDDIIGRNGVTFPELCDILNVGWYKIDWTEGPNNEVKKLGLDYVTRDVNILLSFVPVGDFKYNFTKNVYELDNKGEVIYLEPIGQNTYYDFHNHILYDYVNNKLDELYIPLALEVKYSNVTDNMVRAIKKGLFNDTLDVKILNNIIAILKPDFDITNNKISAYDIRYISAMLLASIRKGKLPDKYRNEVFNMFLSHITVLNSLLPSPVDDKLIDIDKPVTTYNNLLNKILKVGKSRDIYFTNLLLYLYNHPLAQKYGFKNMLYVFNQVLNILS